MGFLFVAIASAMFGIYPSIQGSILQNGASPLGLVIVCNSFAGLFALAAGMFRRESFRLNRRQTGAMALTGILGLFLTDYLLNLAYTMIPVGFTTMIHFMYPTLVCVAMCILFHEKITPGKIGAIACSIVGLILISGGGLSGSIAGILTALATAFTYCFYMISNDKSAANEVPLMARSFYLNLFVVIAASVLAVIRKDAVFPQSTGDWALSLLVGVMLSTAVMLLNAGIKKLGAGVASFINMLEPVTSMIVSIIVFRYQVSAAAIAGCALILISLVLVTAKKQDAPTIN